jgi:hypothetical protein
VIALETEDENDDDEDDLGGLDIAGAAEEAG